MGGVCNVFFGLSVLSDDLHEGVNGGDGGGKVARIELGVGV